MLPERHNKKKRQLKMKVKSKVLDKLDARMGAVAIGNLFNISESTVKGTKVKHEEIKRYKSILH